MFAGTFGVFGIIATAQAHSLPGSVLTFSEYSKNGHNERLEENEQQIKLSISFALEDLIIAAPTFKSLENVNQDQDLSQKDQDQLSAYLEQHLQLQKGKDKLQLELNQASIKKTFHEDIGEFFLVVSELSLLPELSTKQSAQKSTFRLKLTYDAIMHEIRNHRAVVNWSQLDEEKSVRLASFGFRKIEGKQKSIILDLPFF